VNILDPSINLIDALSRWGLREAAVKYGMMKITREYVNKLEAGRYDPTLGVLQRLANALGTDVSRLIQTRRACRQQRRSRRWPIRGKK